MKKHVVAALVGLLISPALLFGRGKKEDSRQSGGISVSPVSAESEGLEETNFVLFSDRFYNPIKSDYQLGDPWMVQHEGFYYYTHSSGFNVFICKSPSISGLAAWGDYTRKTIFNGSSQQLTELWAPELHFYQGYWYCFFAARTNKDSPPNRRMYVLRSIGMDIMGDWEFVGKMNLPEDQWAIDGTFFVNSDGRIYHIWSGWRDDDQGISLARQNLYIAELDPQNPARVISKERVIISRAEHYWEMSRFPQNEGPALVKSPTGTVYCIYAANFAFSNEYALGVLKLVSADPMAEGAWEKQEEPFMASDPENDIYSPGHGSVTKSPDGAEDWLIYHTAKAKDSRADRSARAQKIDWVNDRPYSGKPAPLTVLQPIPSGEKPNRILIQAEDMVLRNSAKIVDIPDGKAVSFASHRDSATAVVSVSAPGDYALFVRHSNATENRSQFTVKVNSSKNGIITAARSGAEGSFTITGVVIPLERGINILAFSAADVVDIDLIILDKAVMQK
jgi:GH43 family beta-xylosidase